MPTTEIKALVFDVFGTIVDWRSGVARGAAAFLDRYAPALDPLEFAVTWRAEYSPSMEEIRSGAATCGSTSCTARKPNCARSTATGSTTCPTPTSTRSTSRGTLDPWPDAVGAATAEAALHHRAAVERQHPADGRRRETCGAAVGCDSRCGGGPRVQPSPQVYSDTVDILGVEPAELSYGRRATAISRPRAPAGCRPRSCCDRPSTLGRPTMTDLKSAMMRGTSMSGI